MARSKMTSLSGNIITSRRRVLPCGQSYEGAIVSVIARTKLHVKICDVCRRVDPVQPPITLVQNEPSNMGFASVPPRSYTRTEMKDMIERKHKKIEVKTSDFTFL